MNPYTKRGSLPKLRTSPYLSRGYKHMPKPSAGEQFVYKTFLIRDENRILTTILFAWMGLLAGLVTISWCGLDTPIINTIEGKKLEQVEIKW